MPKRANPYSEDFIPQSKVHVGDKQYINNADRVRKVHEKTLELLFKGAKKISAPDSLNNNDLNFNNKKEEKMRQLFIGKDGSLLHSGSVMQQNTGRKCCKCGSSVETQCAYCETGLCGGCQHGCERCQKPYCAHCIIVGSDGPEVCVSCYG